MLIERKDMKNLQEMTRCNLEDFGVKTLNWQEVCCVKQVRNQEPEIGNEDWLMEKNIPHGPFHEFQPCYRSRHTGKYGLCR